MNSTRTVDCYAKMRMNVCSYLSKRHGVGVGVCADGGVGGREGEGNAGRRGKPRRNNVVLRVYLLCKLGFQSDFKLAARVQAIRVARARPEKQLLLTHRLLLHPTTNGLLCGGLR